MHGGFVLRLESGAEIIKSILEFCRENNILSGWVWGIGGLKNANLAYYDIDQEKYLSKNFSEVMELISLSGNIASDDGHPFAHLHAVLSGKDMQTFGGHLQSGEVGATCEILIRKFDILLKREAADPDSPLKLLQ